MKKHIPFLIALIIILAASIGYARDLQVSWTLPDDSRVTGVNVYWGQTEQEVRDKVNLIEVPAPGTSTVITDLVIGDPFFVGATSHDANGNESVFSDIIATKVPAESIVIEIPDEAPKEIILKWQ